MAYQQKEGQGSLFTNEKKNDRQPDFKGTIVIKGVTYNLSAWNRTSQKGLSYISIQAEEKQVDAAQSHQQDPFQYGHQPTVYTGPVQAESSDASEEEDLPF